MGDMNVTECPRCGEDFPLSEFYNHPRDPEPVRQECRGCEGTEPMEPKVIRELLDLALEIHHVAWVMRENHQRRIARD